LVVNAEQTEAVLFSERGAASVRPQGSVLVLSVTVSPEYAERVGGRLAERGILMIAGPVSGGEVKASTGQMTMMASGPAEAFARCERILGAIAEMIYRLGHEHGAASKVKMINQLLAGVHTAAAAEAIALGIRSICGCFTK
jgi:L-threonate 2-dehydrogenase